MKTYLAVITATCLTVGALSTSAGEMDESKVIGDRLDQGVTRDQLAINSCVESFVAEILPGTKATIRTVTGDHEQVFDRRGSIIRPVAMHVPMTATAASDGAVLATGTCRVNRSAKVVSLKTRTRDSERLAGLSLKDLRFVAGIQ